MLALFYSLVTTVSLYYEQTRQGRTNNTNVKNKDGDLQAITASAHGKKEK